MGKYIYITILRKLIFWGFCGADKATNPQRGPTFFRTNQIGPTQLNLVCEPTYFQMLSLYQGTDRWLPWTITLNTMGP